MSHAQERSEKVCLNCQAEIYGRFCHLCGQENREPKESLWSLIIHYFNDLTHFDGKFFSTLRYLVFKPGFLPAEYIKGKRASYLNPIRMYIFTSAIFFIIFFSFYDESIFVRTSSEDDETATVANDSARATNRNYWKGAVSGDSVITGNAAIDSLLNEPEDEDKKILKASLTPNKYRSPEHYDSVQKALPASERDGWFKRLAKRRQIVIEKKYGDDDKAFIRAWVNALIHQFPKILFVSLPLIALILKLLYIRRKQFYYVDHIIWTINLYIFGFILMLIGMGITALGNLSGWGIFGWLSAGLWIYAFYYNYKAMRVFYGQSRGKTIVKFLLMTLLTQLTILILFALFIVFTIFQV